MASWTAPREILEEAARAPLPGAAGDAGPGPASRRIADRENEYKQRRLRRQLSPERAGGAQGFGDAMRAADLAREREQTRRNIERKREREREEGAPPAPAPGGPAAPGAGAPAGGEEPSAKRGKVTSEWDEAHDAEEAAARAGGAPRRRNRWDETPVGPGAPGAAGPSSRWDQTPVAAGPQKAAGGAASARPRSRWDETPVAAGPGGSLAPGAATPAGLGASGMATPLIAGGGGASLAEMTPEQFHGAKWERDIAERNRPLTDEDLDALLPGEGYRVLEPPASYQPIRTPARKLLATPTPVGQTPLYHMPQAEGAAGGGAAVELPTVLGDNLPDLKPEDVQYFGKLATAVEEADLSAEEAKERHIMRLLLKVKNGTAAQRKAALRTLTVKARDFGGAALFGQLLPLLMSPTLEDQERHLLVKVVDRVLYRLDDAVRPHVHKILVVIEPLLIDEDYFARVEGREIVANLAKAAGLATMIAAMRPDIDHVDEYVRNTTARAFSVVASALGIPALLPFLRAVCLSRRSWEARHTGMKIVQQIAVLMGCAVLPHLRGLVGAVAHGLGDDSTKVRTISALALAALAEASAPYGIEGFDPVLKPLWKGVRTHRGKTLAAFLKAIGFVVPLMDPSFAGYYTREVMVILLREFATPDEEMKKIVLKVVRQCVGTEGVEADYIRAEVLPDFCKHFWVRRTALDRRSYQQLVETTEEVARKVGCRDVVSRLVDGLKDESEPFRRMVMEAVGRIVRDQGVAEIDARLEELLVDGALYAYQEQQAEGAQEKRVLLEGFSTVVTALGPRAKPYLPQICGTVKWRLNNKSATVREQAADLISHLAPVLAACEEEELLGHLGVVLYEYLGEEYPDVLGSILGALGAIVSVAGMTRMTPPIKDLLPRLTPVLKNRHEKVLENCIELVGRIADRGAEFVPAREWMRICFELLETLKAHRRSIRRVAVNTFGYIAKAIGPQDVLATLLNNLKVQERQNRVCTTVAIAIVAEACGPFTVLPALMNEYRVPEMNVQNGVLKSLSFLFEYIGEASKDYIYAVAPLLEDAMTDRDAVHRQTAATSIAHLTLGVAGLGCEDAVLHLLNFIWPNIFEASPHVANAMRDALDAMRVTLGPGILMNYLLQGLFHPARKVRDVYWGQYNSLLVGAGDALVPFQPRAPDTPRNAFRRHELDLVL